MLRLIKGAAVDFVLFITLEKPILYVKKAKKAIFASFAELLAILSQFYKVLFWHRKAN
ncbi:hypothetical protein [Shewanella pneumatophori]|uniref:Uncharacterized protein n=1 Tax=Shewanella pneumatophori TaxID=314092 RepID=A0A9X1Z814_9GAMM|nr:hypothetical protein [Shewanella pneumatophori]MCL1137214.1 hypothetical protein [Shewanella pneumatophori]